MGLPHMVAMDILDFIPFGHSSKANDVQIQHGQLLDNYAWKWQGGMGESAVPWRSKGHNVSTCAMCVQW